MPVFTIKTLAAESDDILAQYPYWIWYPAEQTLTISKSTFEKTKANESNGIIFRAPGADADIETTTFYYYYITPTEPDVTVVLRYYENLGVWQAEMPWELETDDGWIECPIGYQHQYSTSKLAVPIYTNGHTIATGSGTGITNSWSVNGSLPSDMPDVTIGMGDINATINDALNATTSTTAQAGAIQSTVNSNLDSLENGLITSAEMQQIIDTANTELNNLASQEGNTLADQIAINNAQNSTQIAQDRVNTLETLDLIAQLFVLDNTVFNNWQDLLNEIIQYTDNTVNHYNNGYITKNTALRNDGYSVEGGLYEGLGLSFILNTLENVLSNPQEFKGDNYYTDAERNSINAAIAYVQSQIDIVNSAGDVDKEKADAFESSESEELEYLDELTSETTAKISDISPKEEFTEEELGAASNIMNIIWENKLVKQLLVICGCFMVVCVVLGIRYKV